jgi:hypothetical protein
LTKQVWSSRGAKGSLEWVRESSWKKQGNTRLSRFSVEDSKETGYWLGKGMYWGQKKDFFNKNE